MTAYTHAVNPLSPTTADVDAMKWVNNNWHTLYIYGSLPPVSNSTSRCGRRGSANNFSNLYSVILHLRHIQTNCLFVCLSICPMCLSGASILRVDEARCFIEI